MLVISELFIYPIKSLGGISLNNIKLTDRGMEYDRRWMLVDNTNTFITQRSFPNMALIRVKILNGSLDVTSRRTNKTPLYIPLMMEGGIKEEVFVWDDSCMGVIVSNEANEWFSEELETPCKLVYMPETSIRIADTKYAKISNKVAFCDAYPVTIIGEASLEDLNSRLKADLKINRFRPNILMRGGDAYEKDRLKLFTINGINFSGVKLLARCPIITIEQETAKQGKEPLNLLSMYRKKNNKVYFGQNLIYNGEGNICVGNEIKVLEREEATF